MGNALVTQVEALRGELEAKKENIFAAAAEHIRPERFLEQVARACIKEPKLLNCSRASLFIAAAQGASLGLEIDGVLGHAYIVPFGGDAVLVPGYLGLKELAYRSGRIASMEMCAVHAGDEFDFEKGTAQFLRHKPSDSAANSAVTHVYSIVHTTTGGTIFEVMSWAQVEKHRNKFSKGYARADSSWQTNPTAMALKTVLRKALKLAPLSPELQRMMQHEEYAEQPLFQSGADVPVEDLDAAAELLEDHREPRPSDPTPEELRDWEAEKMAATTQTDIRF